jgi:hypothetical protein
MCFMEYLLLCTRTCYSLLNRPLLSLFLVYVLNVCHFESFSRLANLLPNRNPFENLPGHSICGQTFRNNAKNLLATSKFAILTLRYQRYMKHIANSKPKQFTPPSSYKSDHLTSQYHKQNPLSPKNEVCIVDEQHFLTF